VNDWALPSLALMLAMSSAVAQAEVKGGGKVTATARVGTTGCIDQAGTKRPSACTWMDFNDAAVLAPWIEARPNQRVHVRAAIDLRFHGATEAATLEAIEQPNELQPWSVRVRDLWLSTQGEHLSFKIGSQRIAWGVANGVSVVDNINPLDLEDPTRFDKRLSVLSAKSIVHTGSFSATAVAAPFFVPAALPATKVDLMAGASDVFSSDGVQINSLETRADAPTNTLSDTALAGHLRWTPPALDLALSWYHGRDSLPQVAGDVLLIGYQTKTDEVDVGVPLVYPMLDVAGLTARGELPGEMTGWAEAALVMPQATTAAPSKNQLEALVRLGTLDELPSPYPTTVTQDGKPFPKWVLGLDREFGPVRLTAQWLHGFFTERSARDVRDYGLLAIRWGITPTLRLDGSGSFDGAGYFSDAALVWLHADTLELSLGGSQIDGPDGSSFGGLRSASNVRLSASMAF
jgi:hypothetical protein